jgi:hypothetical protein
MQRLLQEQEKERETRSRRGGRGEEEGGGAGAGCPVETVTRGESMLDLYMLEKVTRECQDARRQKKHPEKSLWGDFSNSKYTRALTCERFDKGVPRCAKPGGCSRGCRCTRAGGVQSC